MNHKQEDETSSKNISNPLLSKQHWKFTTNIQQINYNHIMMKPEQNQYQRCTYIKHVATNSSKIIYLTAIGKYMNEKEKKIT